MGIVSICSNFGYMWTKFSLVKDKKIVCVCRKSNIFDNIMSLMEKYAFNLEELVEERTNQLLEEKKKTENLLLRMLPKYVNRNNKKINFTSKKLFI